MTSAKPTREASAAKAAAQLKILGALAFEEGRMGVDQILAVRRDS